MLITDNPVSCTLGLFSNETPFLFWHSIPHPLTFIFCTNACDKGSHNHITVATDKKFLYGCGHGFDKLNIAREVNLFLFLTFDLGHIRHAYTKTGRHSAEALS